jgi:hypothetical protein
MKPSRQRAMALAAYVARAWLSCVGPALAQPVIVPTTTNQISITGTPAAITRVVLGQARLLSHNSEE